MSRFLNLLAALASFGAFAMLIQWGFTLSTLDPSDIPVIKKAEGPARVAPDDPGGEIVGTQGLALNAIQSKGAAESTSEQVVLAPRAEPFQPEDVAGIDIENRLPEATEAAANVEEIIADALKNDVQGTLTMASELSEDLKKADETAMAKAKALFGITDDAQTGEEVVAKTATPEVVEEKPTEVAQTPENDPLAIRPKRRPSELKAVAKVEPEAPEGKSTSYTLEKNKKELACYYKKSNRYVGNKAKVFLIVKGQCTLCMKDKLKAMMEFEEFEKLS